MKKIAEVLEEIDSIVKVGFIPNPSSLQRQQQEQQAQQQQQGSPSAPPAGSQGGPHGHVGTPEQGGSGKHQGGGDGAGMEELLSQLPPEIQQQIASLPPEQQQQAIQQLLQQQQMGDTGGIEGSDPSQDPAAAAGPEDQSVVQSSGPPTDMEKSTVTLKLRDLLDLVSGGKATQSTLKVQEHYSKQQMRQQQMQQKQEQDAQKQQMEQQMQQQQAAMNGGMMGQGGAGGAGGGGIY